MSLSITEKKRLKSRIRQEQFEGKQFILMVYVVLKRHYPDFEALLDSIPDHRKRKTYEVAELIMAGLSMFIFKRGSRNQADLGVYATFEQNYARLLGMRIPVMDTLDVFLRKLAPEELEKLKTLLVKRLIEKKVLSLRAGRKSTIITTNLGFERWAEIFGDRVLTAALVDRLTHKAHLVNNAGDSYRLKETKQMMAK